MRKLYHNVKENLKYVYNLEKKLSQNLFPVILPVGPSRVFWPPSVPFPLVESFLSKMVAGVRIKTCWIPLRISQADKQFKFWVTWKQKWPLKETKQETMNENLLENMTITYISSSSCRILYGMWNGIEYFKLKNIWKIHITEWCNRIHWHLNTPKYTSNT